MSHENQNPSVDDRKRTMEARRAEFYDALARADIAHAAKTLAQKMRLLGEALDSTHSVITARMRQLGDELQQTNLATVSTPEESA